MRQYWGQFAAVLLVYLAAAAVKASKDDDENTCQRIKSRLFGTKTMYEDARRALRHLDDDDLPKPFDDDSLEHEHKDLIKDDCRPVALYFLGRHSARFPDSEDIEKYNKDLLELIGRMNSSSSSGGSGGCRNNRKDFLSWTPKMQPKHDNLITELGGREERNIARRFKRLYPDLFDARKADIKFGVTKKVRTAQTGSEFLKEVDGLNLDESCKQTPTNDLTRPDYSLDRVLEAACYKYLIANHRAPFLDFRKDCEKISGIDEIKDPLIDRVKDPKLQQRMARRVARKLGLTRDDSNGGDKQQALTVDQLDSIWDTCKFETALRNESVWCSLFEKKDVEMLEYIEDLNTYIKHAYGPQANPRQSCPVVGNLVESFQDVINMYTSPEASNKPHRPRAYFYFAHSDLIKTLLAAFGMFKDDESFTAKRVADFESNLKAPKKRRWRTSLVSPFSANIAFVLYRCPASSGKQDKFKVLASVTEQPVKLGGCKDTDCNIQRFMGTYENMRNCDLNSICRRV